MMTAENLGADISGNVSPSPKLNISPPAISRYDFLCRIISIMTRFQLLYEPITRDKTLLKVA